MLQALLFLLLMEPDSSYGARGIFYAANHLSEVRTVRFVNDGSAVLYGIRQVDQTLHTVLIRVRPDGFFDTDFGVDGFVTTLTAGSASALVVTASGAIYHASGAFVERFLPDGLRDSNFGDNGVLRFTGPDAGTVQFAEAYLGERLVLVRRLSETPVQYHLVESYTETGEHDLGFSENGTLLMRSGDYPLAEVRDSDHHPDGGALFVFSLGWDVDFGLTLRSPYVMVNAQGQAQIHEPERPVVRDDIVAFISRNNLGVLLEGGRHIMQSQLDYVFRDPRDFWVEFSQPYLGRDTCFAYDDSYPYEGVDYPQTLLTGDFMVRTPDDGIITLAPNLLGKRWRGEPDCPAEADVAFGENGIKTTNVLPSHINDVAMSDDGGLLVHSDLRLLRFTDPPCSVDASIQLKTKNATCMDSSTPTIVAQIDPPSHVRAVLWLKDGAPVEEQSYGLRLPVQEGAGDYQCIIYFEGCDEGVASERLTVADCPPAAKPRALGKGSR